MKTKVYLECKKFKKKAKVMYKNEYYCQECSISIYNKQDAYLYLETISINKNYPAKIYRFLNSISICIKLILLKCDYLLKQTNIESIEFDENGKKINAISFTHDINYPFIKDPDNIDSYITFLGDIEKTLNKEYKFNNFKHENFFPSKLNGELIEAIKYILIDKNRGELKKAFDSIDTNFSLSEDSFFYINEIEID